MRSFFAGLSALVATLALALALPVGWVAQHVADEDGYVAFSAELVDDPKFRGEIVQAVTDDIVKRAGVPDAFAPPVRSALQAASADVVESPDFRSAFGDAQRETHRAVFGDAADMPAGMEAEDRVVIDLAPVAQTIIDAATANLPVSIEAPEQLMVAVGGSEERQAVDAIDRMPRQAIVLLAVAAVAASLSLLAARRSSSMLAWLGFGAIVAAGLARVLSMGVLSALMDSSNAPSALAARAQRLLADAALASLDEWLIITVVGGGIAVALGLLVRAISGSR
ncbi:MAG: hypothetical protein WB508_03215 [Aeromicrobium sp.]|uniref:hypothetical protein n=1 Tax=Aeromicrobium sp. TaxID=1871063 RepID=UPI003C42CC90